MTHNPDSIVELIRGLREDFMGAHWTRKELAEFLRLHAREYERGHKYYLARLASGKITTFS